MLKIYIIPCTENAKFLLTLQNFSHSFKQQFSKPMKNPRGLMHLSIAIFHLFFPSMSFAQSGLGSLSIDGGLEQEFSLGSISSAEDFKLVITLKHRLAKELPARSIYSIPQLQTSLTLRENGDYHWQALDGQSFAISAKSCFKDAPQHVSSGIFITKFDPLDHVKVHHGKVIYAYQMGSLKSIHASGRSYQVGSDHRGISSITDQNGRKILSVSYGEAGLLSEISLGTATHHFKYDPETKSLTSWQPPGVVGQPIRFSYTDLLVTSIALPAGQALTYQWMKPEEVKLDKLGLQLPPVKAPAYLVADKDFQYTYGVDSRGLHLYKTDKLQHNSGFIYHPEKQSLTKMDDQKAQSTTFYTKLANGRSVTASVQSAEGDVLLKLGYDEQGRVNQRREYGKAPLSYHYDEQDRIKEIRRLDEVITRYEYQGQQTRPSLIIDALGQRTEMGYNENGQLIRYRGTDGGQHEMVYENGRRISHRYPSGHTETWKYDHAGRLLRHQALDGTLAEYTYDGSRLSQMKKGQAQWDYQFDDKGRLSTLLKDGKEWQEIERTALSADIEEVAVKQQGQLAKTITLKEDGTVLKERDAQGKETEYQHDTKGEVAGWTDPRGVIAEFERDSLGRVTSLETAHGRELDLQYDPIGRIKRKKTAEQDIRYHYNDAGQLISIDYSKDQTVTYTYDKHSRTNTATTSQGVKTTYTWDALDRKTSERTDLPTGEWSLIRWTYTASGKKQSVSIYKNGEAMEHLLQKTEYRYDALQRPTAILIDGQEKLSYTYDPKSLLLANKKFSNGKSIQYEYTKENRPQKLKATNPDGKVLKEVTYTWNDAGKLQSRILDGVLHEYSYDTQGRLTEVKKTKGEAASENEPDKRDS